MRRGLAIALLLAGCKSANPNAMGDAVLGTAAGLTAAGVSRSQGGCYASCAFGTFCDEKTGTCVALPCHDQCGKGELCDTSGPVDRCVVAPDLEVQRASAAPTTKPADAKPAPANDVPTREK